MPYFCDQKDKRFHGLASRSAVSKPSLSQKHYWDKPLAKQVDLLSKSTNIYTCDDGLLHNTSKQCSSQRKIISKEWVNWGKPYLRLISVVINLLGYYK